MLVKDPSITKLAFMGGVIGAVKSGFSGFGKVYRFGKFLAKPFYKIGAPLGVAAFKGVGQIAKTTGNILWKHPGKSFAAGSLMLGARDNWREVAGRLGRTPEKYF